VAALCREEHGGGVRQRREKKMQAAANHHIADRTQSALTPSCAELFAALA